MSREGPIGYTPPHAQLCGIVGGYGYCTCGQEKYVEKIATQQARCAAYEEALVAIVDGECPQHIKEPDVFARWCVTRATKALSAHRQDTDQGAEVS